MAGESEGHYHQQAALSRTLVARPHARVPDYKESMTGRSLYRGNMNQSVIQADCVDQDYKAILEEEFEVLESIFPDELESESRPCSPLSKCITFADRTCEANLCFVVRGCRLRGAD
jgi:hypothetical protein